MNCELCDNFTRKLSQSTGFNYGAPVQHRVTVRIKMDLVSWMGMEVARGPDGCFPVCCSCARKLVDALEMAQEFRAEFKV